MVVRGEPAALGVSGRLDIGKAFEVRVGTGEWCPELGVSHVETAE